MKILCPKCSSENDTENAVAGVIQCQCGEWFQEPRPPGFVHGGLARSLPSQPAKPLNAGAVIWPVVLLLVIVAGAVGFIPMLFAFISAVMAILGSIVSLLAQKK